MCRRASSSSVRLARAAAYAPSPHTMGSRRRCAITELVIFTEPYGVASNNRHTTPQLDAAV
eukprot:1649689-Pyramimonas_sp.AAC.1